MKTCSGCEADWREYRRVVRVAYTRHLEGQPVDVIAVDTAKALAYSCTHPVRTLTPLEALVAERFGAPTPPPPPLPKASALAIRELLEDLESAHEVAQVIAL